MKINKPNLVAKRPVNQVEVQVIKPQVFQGLANSFFNFGEAVKGIPALLCNKKNKKKWFIKRLLLFF